VQRGALGYDDKVADHWPEFAAAGKGEITVGQMLSHQAGLIAVDDRLDFDSIMSVTPMVDALAAQAPLWPLGTGHGYHAITYGWLAGELIARVDGRRIGQFVREELAARLGLDMWIGLPESEEERVSTIEVATAAPTDPAAIEMMMKVLGPGTNGYRALTLDGVIRTMPENHFNSRALHATEMPGANGITTARSLARMYAATIGDVDGTRLLAHDTMQAARTERANGPDLTLVAETRFGAGYMLHCASQPMIQDGSFGHPGAGGSLGFANPELGIGFGYVMNQMGSDLVGDARHNALADATLAAIS
jgi:CubicO group peptidase (beta-lactamase class C family)